jgi:hypothetical protein
MKKGRDDGNVARTQEVARAVWTRRRLDEINHSFSVVGAFVIGDVNLAARDQPRRVTRAAVNAELLEALAVQPEHGRWFRREKTRAGGPALVMYLTHRRSAAERLRGGYVIRKVGVVGELPGSIPVRDPAIPSLQVVDFT